MMAAESVKNNPSYTKGSDGIVNINDTEYNRRISKLRSEAERTDEISELKSDMAEIKCMLAQLLNGVK